MSMRTHKQCEAECNRLRFILRRKNNSIFMLKVFAFLGWFLFAVSKLEPYYGGF